MVTCGIEEEFFLVDRSSLEPVSVAEGVLDDLASESTASGRVTGEFLASRIEWLTQILTEMESAVTSLARFRAQLDSAARLHGVMAVGTGTPFDVPATPTVAEGDRYRRVVRDVRGVLRDLPVVELSRWSI